MGALKSFQGLVKERKTPWKTKEKKVFLSFSLLFFCFFCQAGMETENKVKLEKMGRKRRVVEFFLVFEMFSFPPPNPDQNPGQKPDQKSGHESGSGGGSREKLKNIENNVSL